MITLETLQEMRAVPAGCRVISPKFGETIHYAVVGTDRDDGVRVPVVPGWVATVGGKSLMTAPEVYSSDGDVVGVYHAKKEIFFLTKVANEQLQTIKFLRRLSDMAIPVDEIKNNMKDVADDIKKAAGTQNVNSFTGNEGQGTGEQNTDGQKTEHKTPSRQDVANERIRGIKARVHGVQSANNNAARFENRKNGRFLFFITKDDPVVQLSIKNSILVENGMKVVDSSNPLTAEEEQKAKEGKLPASRYLHTKQWVFKHKKPGKVVGMVISTPAGSESDFISLNKEVQVREDQLDVQQIRILDPETAYCYLAFNYGDAIRESDEILKNQAGTLTIKRSVTTSAKDNSTKIVTRMVHDKTQNRKTLLVPGNFFPVKLYVTANPQTATDNERIELNNNVLAALKSGKHQLGAGESGKTTVIPGDKDKAPTATSVWFDDKAPIEVLHYANGEKITDVNVAVRESNPCKSKPGEFTYKYKYYTLEDRNHGPLSDSLYKKIAALTKLSEEQFVQEVLPLTAVKRSTSGSKKEIISADEYLKLKSAREYNVDGETTLDAISAKIAKIAM